MTEFTRRWPLERFPIFDDGDRTVVEATAIFEYLAGHRPGPVELIPNDRALAVEVRRLDLSDNDVMTPVRQLVSDARRAMEDRDAIGVAQAREMLQKAYRRLDARMAGRTWAVAESFTMVDCAAAPSLFHADWTHAIDPALVHVHAYRKRLLARPSFVQLVDEADRIGRGFRWEHRIGAEGSPWRRDGPQGCVGSADKYRRRRDDAATTRDQPSQTEPA